MRQYIARFIRLMGGLFLYALGIIFTLKANIGYAPWEVFHVGLSSVTGISLGLITILVGLVVVIITTLLKEKLGLGTILNMIFIGIVIDIINWLDIIPKATNMVPGIIMLIAGLFIIALGSYFYMGSAFGAGPRDSLMVALTRMTKLPVGVCRAIIELTVMIIGWLLGGMVGIGTVISVFATGFCIQVTFKLLKFDTTKIQHETMDQTFNKLKKANKVTL